MASSNFQKVCSISLPSDQLIIKTELRCNQLPLISNVNKPDKSKQSRTYGRVVDFQKINIDMIGLPPHGGSSHLLTNVLKYLTISPINDDAQLKINVLETLPSFSKHLSNKFHSLEVGKIWFEMCGDEDRDVRRTFAEIVAQIIQYEQVRSGHVIY